eukprot:GFUD01032924.1.p1 GENE.GFUD01032924.1~~GFUD01032924.1.p1  ORF type:complete len:434 (+),score=123.10 GFUD01032924.1:465-1766(+)
MNLLLTKLVTMVILGLCSFIIGLSTIQLRKCLGLQASEVRRSQTVITSLLLCFGAGVLLATSMLHILPETRHGMEEAQESLGISWLAELVVCAGFFLVYLVEELVHLTLHGTPHREQLHRTLSLRKSVGLSDSTCNTVPNCCEDEGSDCHNDMEMKETDSNTAKYNPKYEVRLSISTSDMFPNYHSPDSLVVPKEENPKPNSVSSDTGHNPGHSHSHLGTSQSTLRDFFTVLALSFHAVFEGLAVGLEEDTEDVWALFTAISVHKFVITFCVSLELLQTGTSMLVFLCYLVTFSLVSPMGIGVGMLISEMATGEDYYQLTVAVLQGLAGGTILYIVMFEVLQREKEKNIPGIFQLFGILLGFGAMMMIELFGKHEHSHEEQGGLNITLQHLHHLGVHQADSLGTHTGLGTQAGAASESGLVNTTVLSVLGIID